MQRWKCCSSWSKQNPKHFSNTGFPQGKPVFFSAYIFLAPEWPEEKAGEHTVCPSCGESCGVIRQKESVKNVPCTGMAGEKVGEHTVCSSCGEPCTKEGQSREAELIEWRSAQKRRGMSGLFCPEIFGILNMMETVCTVCTEGGIR